MCTFPSIYVVFETSVASITVFTSPFCEKLKFRTNATKYLNNYKSSYGVNPAVQIRLKCVFGRGGMKPEYGLQKQCGRQCAFKKA